MENGSLTCFQCFVWMRIALSTILLRIHVCGLRCTTAARRNRSRLCGLRHRCRRIDALRLRSIIRILRERGNRTRRRRRLLLILDLILEDRARITASRREDLRVVHTPRDPEALVDDLDAGRDHEIRLNPLAEDIRNAIRADVNRNTLAVDDRRLHDPILDWDLEAEAGCILTIRNTRTIRLTIAGSREIRTVAVRHALRTPLLTKPTSAVCNSDVDDLGIEIMEEVVELAEIPSLRTGTSLVLRVATRETTEELLINLPGLLILTSENTTGEAHLGKADLEILTVVLERDCNTSLGVLAGLRRGELGDVKVASGDDGRRHLDRVYLYHLKKPPDPFSSLIFRLLRKTRECGVSPFGNGDLPIHVRTMHWWVWIFVCDTFE